MLTLINVKFPSHLPVSRQFLVKMDVWYGGYYL